jgi:hypothetical protein
MTRFIYESCDAPDLRDAVEIGSTYSDMRQEETTWYLKDLTVDQRDAAEGQEPRWFRSNGTEAA